MVRSLFLVRIGMSDLFLGMVGKVPPAPPYPQGGARDCSPPERGGVIKIFTPGFSRICPPCSPPLQKNPKFCPPCAPPRSGGGAEWRAKIAKNFRLRRASPLHFPFVNEFLGSQSRKFFRLRRASPLHFPFVNKFLGSQNRRNFPPVAGFPLCISPL